MDAVNLLPGLRAPRDIRWAAVGKDLSARRVAHARRAVAACVVVARARRSATSTSARS